MIVDHGPWTVEGSFFNRREPDEERRDFDFGRLDSVSARLWYKPSSEVLRTGMLPEHGEGNNAPVGAFTVGGVRDVVKWRGTEGGLGAQVPFCATPDSLKSTHGDHPVSYQVLFRFRLPAGAMGRRWNLRMSQPMTGHEMAGMSGMK